MATAKMTTNTIEAAGSFEELSALNIRALTTAVQASTEALDALTSKVTSIACHVTALEALLKEVITVTGVDLAQVNTQIRTRIKGVDGRGHDADAVVDIAASLASPATGRMV